MQSRFKAVLVLTTLTLTACAHEESPTEPFVEGITEPPALAPMGAPLTPGAQVIYSNLGLGDSWSNTNGWSGPSLCTPTDCPGSPGALSKAFSFVAPADFALTDLELAVSDIGDPYNERPGQVTFDVGLYTNSNVLGLDRPDALLGSQSTTAPENRYCTLSTDPTCLPFGLTPLLTLTTVTFATPIPLTGGQRYWIGLHPSNDHDKIDIAWWWNYQEGAVQSRTWTSGGGGAINFSEVQLGGSWTSTQVQIESAFRVSGIPATFGCGSVTEIPQSECEALVALYNSTDGDNWTNKTGWLQTNTPCSWYGVSCVVGYVGALLLGSNHLGGHIPPEIGDLPHLASLILEGNELTGSIPPELGNLHDLEVLYASHNQLSGSIPSELGDLSNLLGLNLGTNQLTGEIPSELGNLSHLDNLYLTQNELVGPIPAALGNLGDLSSLGLNFNQLSGEIPASLAGLGKLAYLFLEENELTGAIPPWIGTLGSLVSVRLRANHLSGSIPDEIGNLSNLQYLDLSFNELSGSIPGEIGNLGQLTTLGLSANQLTGSIPPELGDLAHLTTLGLTANQLTGEIPKELGDLAQLEFLNLSNNPLTGSIPTELGNLSNLRTIAIRINMLSGLVPLAIAALDDEDTACALAPNPGLYMPATADYQALGDPICGIPLTPLEDLAAEVSSQIVGLVESGELAGGLGNALTRQFEKALEKLNTGKTAPATNMLQDLIDQISDLIADGQISAAEGENLILLATALLP